jgi:hypothetical protein
MVIMKKEILKMAVKAILPGWKKCCKNDLLVYRKGKALSLSLTGHGRPYGYETSRLPHFLDNRPTDGGEVVSLTRRPPFTPRKIPGTHFC